MKIISKFKDYYDNVKGLYDEDLVWVREESGVDGFLDFPKDYRASEVCNFNNSVYFLTKTISRRSSSFCNALKEGEVKFSQVHLYVVCGELHYCVEFSEGYKDENMSGSNLVSRRSIFKWGKEHIPEMKTFFYSNWNKDVVIATTHLEKYDWNKVHDKTGSPIIKISEAKATINEPLGVVGFATVIDPWTMATKINSFVSCCIPNINERDMLKVSNEDKIKAHGFDLKTSFRKGKSK